MPATRGQCTNKIFVIPYIHSRLQPRLFVERSLQCATEVLDNTRPEYLDRICSFLLANPAQPPVAGRHMRDLIIVDDLQRLDTFLVLCFPELVDLDRVDIQAARFVQSNPEAAADVYLRINKSNVDRKLLLSIIKSPEVKFTLEPRNTYQLAQFMHRIGAIKNKPASARDYFFNDGHNAKAD